MRSADDEAALRAFLADRLLPVAPWQAFTAYLLLRPGADGPAILLLETNPPVSSGTAFPGLFHGGSLDGGLRLP